MNLIGQQLAIGRLINRDTLGSGPPVRRPGPRGRSRSDLPDRWRGRRGRGQRSRSFCRQSRNQERWPSAPDVKIVAIGNAKGKGSLIDAAARELVRSERCFHEPGKTPIYSRDMTTVAIAHPAIELRRRLNHAAVTALVWRRAPPSYCDAVLPDDMSMMMVVRMAPSAVGSAAASSIGVIGGNRQPPESGELCRR